MAIANPATSKLYLLRHSGAELWSQRLPLDGQHPVALQVPECAVVGDDLKPVAQRLEAAARSMPPVGAPADQLAEQRCSLLVIEGQHSVTDRLLRRSGGFEQQRCEQVVLVAFDAQQLHRRSVVRAGGVAQPKPPRPAPTGAGSF